MESNQNIEDNIQAQPVDRAEYFTQPIQEVPVNSQPQLSKATAEIKTSDNSIMVVVGSAVIIILALIGLSIYAYLNSRVN